MIETFQNRKIFLNSHWITENSLLIVEKEEQKEEAKSGFFISEPLEGAWHLFSMGSQESQTQLNNKNRLAWLRVATNLQFIKLAVSAKHSKAKPNQQGWPALQTDAEFH